jgi:teichuronic acid biosynthesis glycosyltransferase TuaH
MGKHGQKCFEIVSGIFSKINCMLENEHIVCISYSTWEGPYTKSVVQLMSLLAIKNKVLFVEYPFTWKDVISTLRGKQKAPVGRMLGFKNRLSVKNTAENAQVYQWIIPPLLPMNSIQNAMLYSLTLKINTFIYRRSIKKALRRLKWENPINIFAYSPIFGESLSGKLPEKANIYYCYDGYPTDRRGLKSWEADQRFSKITDGIIVSSDYLKNQKLTYNPKVATVKNGVDFEVFNQKAKTNINPVETRRKIGYIGSIDQRFDIETVEFSVRNLPDCDFELIGDIRNIQVKNTLEQFPNVRFIPPVKPNEVPERLNQCDVGIIPYLCTEINKNVYPLKINEYLAVGVPVVITKFANLPEFSEHVAFASSKEEFLNSLNEVLKNDSSEKINQRIEFARTNSWKARAELFSKEVSSFIALKSSEKEMK